MKHIPQYSFTITLQLQNDVVYALMHIKALTLTSVHTYALTPYASRSPRLSSHTHCSRKANKDSPDSSAEHAQNIAPLGNSVLCSQVCAKHAKLADNIAGAPCFSIYDAL